MRIALATGWSSAAGWHALRRLEREHNLRAVIFERHRNGLSARQYLLRRARRVGWPQVLDETAYRLLHALRHRRRNARHLRETFGPPEARGALALPALLVDSINDERVPKLIRRLEVDVLAVIGTTILRRPVIDAPARAVLNIHTGITPEYRGVHSAWWAIARRDYQRIGVTVHFIDPGIDTGQVIAQRGIPVDPQDTHTTLAATALRAGVDLLCDILSQLERGAVATLDTSGRESRLYSHPRLSKAPAYWRGRLQLAKDGA